MKTFLVTVEHPDEAGIVAGIYVQAYSAEGAKANVSKFIGECKLVAWARPSRTERREEQRT